MITPTQVARYTLGFSWVYQGIAPKLLTVAPLEKALTGSMGFSDHVSNLITRGAGVGEVIFGIILIVFYQHRGLLLLNMAVLLGLLCFSAIMLSYILIEAFNPVTTNLCMIALSYFLFYDSINNDKAG